MAPTYVPFVNAILSIITETDGVQTSSPVWWHTLAPDWKNESGTSIDNGRYRADTGDIMAAFYPTVQDTYITGIASRTGRAMTAVTGTWKSDVRVPYSDRYCIMQQDAALAAWDVKDTATTTTMRNTLVNIRSGVVPAAQAAAHSPTGCYFTLELNYLQTYGYRIVFPWGNPIRVEYTQNAGSTWKQVGAFSDIANVDEYLSSHDRGIDLGIYPDSKRGMVSFELGHGNWVRHSIPRPKTPVNMGDVGSGFPTIENYRLYGVYRWVSLATYPLTNQNPVVTLAPRYFSSNDLRNLQAAKTVTNLVGVKSTTQTETTSLLPDGAGGLSAAITASTTDGAPPRLSDILIYIPSTWETSPNLLAPPEARIGAFKYHERQVWNDATRMGSTVGTITASNANNQYAGLFGNYAINIQTANGYQWAQRLRGIVAGDGEGITVTEAGAYKFATLPVRDFWEKLNQPLGQEVIFDGLCIYTAVRLLLDIGQVNPAVWCNNLPNTGFPGPDGYGSGFPYYILGKGTGLNPKYRFSPDTSVISVLMQLIQDCGQPDLNRGLSIPFYMWFDIAGQFHFEPYDPSTLTPIRYYADIEPTGVGSIQAITAYNSIQDLRTEIIVQGQDAFTYELLQYNFPITSNLAYTGWQKRSLVRNARFSTPEYVKMIAGLWARIGSLPTQIIQMRVPYWPDLCAGMVIGVNSRVINRFGLFQVLELDSVVGHEVQYRGPMDTHCYSTITARAVTRL